MINLSPDAINRIFKKYRAPESIVIAVVGDIRPADILKLIDKYFGGIPATREKPVLVPAEPKQTQERRVDINFDANQELFIGFHKPTAPAYDDYVFDVLETILTKGRTSRLYNLLVTQTGIAKSVGASNGTPGTRYPNLFMISAQPRSPHTNSELEEAILREIEKLKTESVTALELTKAKNHLKMSYIKSLNSNADMASTLSYYEVLLGDYKYFANYLKVIDRISSDDIQRAVNRYFNKDNRTVATLSRKKD